MATTRGGDLAAMIDDLATDNTSFRVAVKGTSSPAYDLGKLSSVREIGSYTVMLDEIGRAVAIIPTANVIALVASREDTP